MENNEDYSQNIVSIVSLMKNPNQATSPSILTLPLTTDSYGV
jgi:hypothetical protein